jgi:FAD/FMN-containing dehydrogenase
MSAPPESDVCRRLALLLGDLPPGAVITDPDAVMMASRVWNAQVTTRPTAVARCLTTSDVQAAVRAARAAGVPLSARGGGHDWAGSAVRDGGLLIDLSPMRHVVVDGGMAYVGGGATVNDLLGATLKSGSSAVVGTVGSVGVAGLTLGGGYGSLIGVAGLAVDNMLSAKVVLADGRVVTADEEREPELFWALRGGGGNFGIVVSLRTRLHPIAEVTTGPIVFAWDEARSVLHGWRDLTSWADDALDVMFALAMTPNGRVLSMRPTWAGDPADAEAQVAHVRALGKPVMDQVARMPLATAVHAMDGMFGPGNYHLGSRILPGLSTEAIEALLESAEAMPGTCALGVHHAHGAATRVQVEATAYPYRDEHLLVQILGAWTHGDGAAEKAWVHETERRLDPHALPGGWAVFMAPGDRRARDAFGPNTDRLLAAKSHYDPEGIFRATPLPA